MRLLSLKKQLQLVFSKAVRKGFDIHKPLTFEASKAADYQSKIALDIFNHHKHLDFNHIQTEVTPGSLASEIRDLLEFHTKEMDVWVDSFGSLQVKIKNSYLESVVNNMIAQGKFAPFTTETFLSNEIDIQQESHQVIFPVIDVLGQITVDHYRHWVSLESVARTLQFFNNKVRRVFCVSNNLPFYGLVLRYMKERPGQPASMEQIAMYLKEVSLDEEFKITEAGRAMLRSLSSDEEMYTIHETLTTELIKNINVVFEPSASLIRLKSRDLKQETISEIIVELCNNTLLSHAECQIHEALSLQEYSKTNNINLTLHRFGETGSSESLISSFFDKTSHMIESRLKDNIPQFQGKVEKYQLRWLNYLFSTVPLDKYIEITPEIITDLVFTKSDQLLSLHSKISTLPTTEFKISSESDRKMAMMAVKLIDHLESNDLAGSHALIERYINVMRLAGSYSSHRLLEIMLAEIYRLSGLV